MFCKVSELSGNALNYAVARSLGKRPSLFIFKQTGKLAKEHAYCEWAIGGPIIEREKMIVRPEPDGQWSAWMHGADSPHYSSGQNPLTSAMRCFVTSKHGNTIEIPDELINQ